jgi:hypothetical protein
MVNRYLGESVWGLFPGIQMKSVMNHMRPINRASRMKFESVPLEYKSGNLRLPDLSSQIILNIVSIPFYTNIHHYSRTILTVLGD